MYSLEKTVSNCSMVSMSNLLIKAGINDNCVPSQITKGYEFESETDTEVIPKLIKYVYDNRESESVTFSTLVERVIQQLVRKRSTEKQIKPVYT